MVVFLGRYNDINAKKTNSTSQTYPCNKTFFSLSGGIVKFIFQKTSDDSKIVF